MKLLVQEYNHNLNWKEAIYKNGRFLSLDGNRIYENRVIHAIKDDNRNKTVVCSACGQEVPNTPSAIRAHRNMVHKSNKCFECSYLRHTNEKVTSQKYVLNDDGTYSESTKRNVKLVCNRDWNYQDINSEKAKSNCRYALCENAKFTHIKDFWTQYPDAFNEFVTIDRIIDMGYKEMYKYNDHVTFRLKGKANLLAYVNSQGICYEICLSYRRSTYTLRYSKKYDKVWAFRYDELKELSHFDFSTEMQETITNKLRALYE